MLIYEIQMNFNKNYILSNRFVYPLQRSSNEHFFKRNSSSTTVRNLVKLCTQCEDVYITRKFDSMIFLGILALLNLKCWPLVENSNEQFVSATPLKLLNRILKKTLWAFWTQCVLPPIIPLIYHQ